jgi:hypothetical protein
MAALFARPPADRLADASVVHAPAVDSPSVNTTDVIGCRRLVLTAGCRLDIAAPEGRIFQPPPGRFLVVAAGRRDVCEPAALLDLGTAT